MSVNDSPAPRIPVAIGVAASYGSRTMIEISHNLGGPHCPHFETLVLTAMQGEFNATDHFEGYLGSERGARFVLPRSDNVPSSRDRTAISQYLHGIRDRAWRIMETALADVGITPNTHQISIYDPTVQR